MKKPLVVLVSIVAIVIGGGVWMYHATNAPAALDPFAQCLRDKGAVMYGASWCPHCKEQKDLFGRAFRLAKYVECAMPGNPQAQAPACRDAGIQGYPTWVFADGSRVSGEQTLAELAEKTGCVLPQ